jgi:hypothetical protein
MKVLHALALLLIALGALGTDALAEKLRAGNGSGFFITADGYFVTNNHVVTGSDGLEVKIGEKVFPARIIKLDAPNDIAVLKVEGNFQCLPLGADLETRPGDDVFTVGFPMADIMGEAPKTTLGIVSAVSGIEDDPRAFQISVQIQPGNSGGPLTQKNTGNVIGVTSSSLNAAKLLEQGRSIPQNVNYAMKASYIRPLLATIPGLLDKLPAPRTAERPFRDVQKETEQSVGLVIVYKEATALRPPAGGAPPPAGGAPPPEAQPQPAAQGAWLFPDSSKRRLTRNELAGLNADELWQARNEIYARNGLMFSTPKGKAFAASLGSSYRGVDSDQDRVFDRMNKIEQANVELIKALEPRRR